MSYEAIRKWFSGKGLASLDSFVLPVLAQAEAAGEWPPKASRAVHAALTKHKVAAKVGERADALYHERSDSWRRDGSKLRGSLEDAQKIWHAWFEIGMAMYHGGRLERAAEGCNTLEEKGGLTEEQAEMVAQAREFIADFAPVWELVEKLDMARPKPVYAFAEISPTVAKTLANLTYRADGLAKELVPTTVRCPEIEWKREKIVDKNGKTYTMMVGYIIWPEGTLHNRSRFSYGTKNNDQCHACGHAIKDGFNWVVLLMDDTNGVPHSLWVGRDCARKLFGVTVTGDTAYKGRV